MKKMILILATIILAVWMTSALIMGGETNTDSFQGQSKGILNKSKAQLEKIAE